MIKSEAKYMNKTSVFCLSFFSTLFLFYSIHQITFLFFSTEANNTFFTNDSVYSILIAAQIAFVIPLLIWHYKNKKHYISFVLFAISTFLASILLVYCNGRAAWLGLVVAMFYILYGKLKVAKYFNAFKCLSVGLVVLFTWCMVLYKADSSSGRLLIYKVSFKMVTDNPWFGIGQFEANYNNYQAVYFATHNINSKEALLADNTFFALNDYYQFLIEHGIVAFAILLLIILLFINQLRKTCFSEHQKPLATAAIASLITVLVAACFSYPLQMLPIVLQVILCVALLSFFILNNKGKRVQIILKPVTIVCIMAFCVYTALQINYKQKALQAFELSRSGFKTKAIEQYSVLSTSYFNHGNYMFLYAKELYNVNQLQKAKAVLNIAKTKFASNEVYKLSASIESELGNYKNAEQDLLKVIYMIPNRMQPRLNMMEFYLQQKDTLQATNWAKSIINMPVKIPSETTKAIQERVKAFLQL